MEWKHWIDQDAAGRKSLVAIIAAVAVAFLGATTSLPASAQATSGISITKHNLGSGGVTGNNRMDTNGTTEVCVFCHTPHAATTGAAPLWNRGAPAGSFTPYSSPSLKGGVGTGGTAAQPGAVSLACLSCHDGVTAMNSVINQPGSGLNPSATGKIAGDWLGTRQTAGVMTGLAAVNLDGLSNDHPIGVNYGGGNATAGMTPIITAAALTPSNGEYKAASTAVIGGEQVFWVDTTIGGSTSRQKTDMLLYNRVSNAQPMVECASCHDPHTNNATFLRIENTYSAVCLSCHVK